MPKKSGAKSTKTTTSTGKKRGRPSKQEQKKAEIKKDESKKSRTAEKDK